MIKAAAALTTVVVSLLVAAPGADANPHKKLTKGVGNCVFSAGAIPKGKFDEWKLTSRFKAGDAVYARCFFGKTLAEFAKEGAMKNSMRGPIEATVAAQAEEPRYYAQLTWTDAASRWWHRAIQVYVESDVGSWDEVRFDQPAGDEATKDSCSFKNAKFDKPDECVDLATETRNLSSYLKKKGAYEGEVCLEVYAYKVDRTKTVDLRTVDDVVALPMARGCFKYRVD